MAKSKYFRVATEGATTDGRVISRDWITQMAKNYSPKTYGARINLEHFAASCRTARSRPTATSSR